MATVDRVREIIAERMIRDLKDVKASDNIITDLGADSLDIAEIVMDVEDEYGIPLQDKKLEGVKTVQDLADAADRIINGV